MSHQTTGASHFDVIIVGAGFSGIYLVHRCVTAGMSVRCYERGDGVGGTWYWNRYPGARCDVESMEYSYGFDEALQQEWEWPEKYSAQPDILRYANHVADRFDVKRHIEFETEVKSAHFDPVSRLWSVQTDHAQKITAKFVVMATGCISTAQVPEIEGLSQFKGETYHTGAWPHEKVDFNGKRVAVIGTGSSGIQAIPEIAKEAGHLTVFQRTANFSIPTRNAPMTADYSRSWKEGYADKRELMRHSHQGNTRPRGEKSALEVNAEERRATLEAQWKNGGSGFLAAFNDILTSQPANDTMSEFVRNKIFEIVKDKRAAEILAPKSHPIGTKRICVDSGYYETFNRDNVDLIDISQEPIERMTESGICVGDNLYEFDTVVFATGFDAMTGTLFNIDIRGRNGLALKEKWVAGPRTYLGLMSEGFPNLFMITGPGSPSVKSNMLTSIEQHVELVVHTMVHMRTENFELIEPEVSAEDKWVDHVQEVANKTLFPQANSWYMGANIPGKPRLFMPYIAGVGTYRRICEEVVADGYRGFHLERLPSAAAAE